MLSLIAFVLFVAAFIVRAVNAGGLEAGDWVLWFLAGMCFLALAPALGWVETRRSSG